VSSQNNFETNSNAGALGINLGTGKVAEARLYCAGVAVVLLRKGSVAIHFGGGFRAGSRTRRKA
jgi:hypothetical protein